MSPLEFLNYTLTYIATSSGEHIYKVTRVLLVRTRQDRVGDEEEEEDEEEDEEEEKGKEGRRVFSIPPTCDSFYSFSLSLTPSFFLFTLFFFLSFRSLRHPASLYHPTSLSLPLSLRLTLGRGDTRTHDTRGGGGGGTQNLLRCGGRSYFKTSDQYIPYV